MQGQRNGRVIQFGAFELRTATGEVRKYGTKVRLQGKPLQILQALLDRPGDVVSREELRERLWAADTFVDFESGLNTAVNRLRLALGDSADHPRYVETLARSGYRFISPVLESHAPDVSEPAILPLPPPEPPKPPQLPARRRWPLLTIVVIAALLLITTNLLFLLRRPSIPQPVFHQLTFRRIGIRAARFAPDGESAIYEGQETPASRDLFMVNPISPESRPLGFAGAFLGGISRSGELALIHPDSSGGRTLLRVPLNGEAPLTFDRYIWGADWAPDGSRLAVIRYTRRHEVLEYPRGKPLYEGAGYLTDARVSPSGNEVAFMEHPFIGDDGGNIDVVNARGERRVLSSGWASADGLAWAPSGREVWFTAARTGLTRALYAVSLSGRLRLIDAFPGTLTLFDISRSGRVLIARQQIHAIMAGISDADPGPEDLSWFDYSTAVDISADGKVVLFGETGEGGGPHHAVYVHRSGSRGAVRAGEGYAAALSPDGNLAVALPDGDQSNLNVLPLTPGQPRILPGHGLKYEFVRFFPSGDRLLVGGRMAGGPPRMYTQALDGSAPQPLPSSTYISRPAISDDGLRVAGVDSDMRLVVLAISEREPKVVTPDFAMRILNWAPGGTSLIAQTDSIPASLVRVDVQSGAYKTWRTIAPFHLAGVTHIWPAAISRDTKTIVYSYQQQLSELFMVEGWR